MNSSSSVTLDKEKSPWAVASESWKTRSEIIPEQIKPQRTLLETKILRATVSSLPDFWSREESSREIAVTVPTTARDLLIRDLGWTREQTMETRLRLRGFQEDWDVPGMEIYDEM